MYNRSIMYLAAFNKYMVLIDSSSNSLSWQNGKGVWETLLKPPQTLKNFEGSVIRHSQQIYYYTQLTKKIPRKNMVFPHVDHTCCHEKNIREGKFNYLITQCVYSSCFLEQQKKQGDKSKIQVDKRLYQELKRLYSLIDPREWSLTLQKKEAT